MIEAGIDEVTMILLPVSELLNSPDRRWYDIANEMVFEAEDKLNLLDLFGERKYMNKAISGYSVGYTYGHHDFFFTVCYHHIWARMGVLIKFSAQALAYYQGQTNLMPYEILQQMRSPLYQVRCSRIDIAVDFIEEGIDINEIYTGYLNEQIKVFVIRERNGRIEHTEKSYKIRDHTPDFLVKFGSILSNFMDLCIREYLMLRASWMRECSCLVHARRENPLF